MIGDPIILNEEDYKKAEIVLKKFDVQKVVLIGGGSGTHKSELAYCLQKILWKRKFSSLVISLDDYYIVNPRDRVEHRKKEGIDSVGTHEIDWESIKRICEDFANKREIHFRRTHLFLDEIEYNAIHSEKINFLIIEGLYANYLRKFYKDNFSVFLEGNPQQTLEFRQKRQKENEDNEFRQKVVQKEFNVVCQLKKHADKIMPFKLGEQNDS